MEKQLKDMLMRASEEIKSLRRENERLAIRVNTLDDLLCLLHAKPGVRVEQGASPDVTWEIEKAIREDDAHSAKPAG